LSFRAPEIDRMNRIHRQSSLYCESCLTILAHGSWARCSLGRLLQVLIVPRQVSFITITLIARALDAVILVGINDHLSVDAQTPQSLIHLLAALNRHVEVALAAEKQSRCLDAIRVQERVGDLLISLPRLRIPRRADLVIVLNDVLIRAVERNRERRPRAPGSCLEAGIPCPGLVGQDSTAAPTPAADSVRSGDA